MATIVDDDGAKLVVDDVMVTEGDAGTVDAVFTVRRMEAHDETVAVDYETAKGTAAISGALTTGE